MCLSQHISSINIATCTHWGKYLSVCVPGVLSMLSSFPSSAGKCLAPLWLQEGRHSACQDRTQAQELPASLCNPRLMALPSHLLAGLGPGSRHSQGLEAAEAPEHASMQRFQLVPGQHQLLHAGRSIEGTLSHLLDLIVTQVSRRRGQSGSGYRQGIMSPAARGDSLVPLDQGQDGWAP